VPSGRRPTLSPPVKKRALRTGRKKATNWKGGIWKKTVKFPKTYQRAKLTKLQKVKSKEKECGSSEIEERKEESTRYGQFHRFN